MNTTLTEVKELPLEEWTLEELNSEELELLSHELMAWCGIVCGGHIDF